LGGQGSGLTGRRHELTERVGFHPLSENVPITGDCVLRFPSTLSYSLLFSPCLRCIVIKLGRASGSCLYKPMVHARTSLRKGKHKTFLVSTLDCHLVVDRSCGAAKFSTPCRLHGCYLRWITTQETITVCDFSGASRTVGALSW
jgi:hypothetical protein